MLKILWKGEEIAAEEQFLLVSTIFFYLILDFYVKGRFLLFQVNPNYANLFSKLSLGTFYKEMSKFQ